MGEAAAWKFDKVPPGLSKALAERFADRPGRVSFKDVDRAIYGRDFWPRELLRLRAGETPDGPAAIVFAREARDVADAVSLCRERGVPLVPYAGGSGVCGGARSPAGALVLDLKGLNRIGPLDQISGIVRAQCGVQGEKLERYLNDRGFTLGHFPSSIYCSTVGGWLATRSAGQCSTKYGKIEDLAVSLDAVLPDGSLVRTPEVPRSAAGPDFKQILIGSEGTLGIITAAGLKVSRLPEERTFQSFLFASWESACRSVREILQRGIRPAVVRVYDEADTQLNASHWNIKAKGVLAVVICEGERRLAADEAREVAAACEARGAGSQGEGPARRWWEHRYDVSYNLSKVLPNPGMLLDTMEVAAGWRELPGLYQGVRAALSKDAMIVLCHLSHAYLTGASLYFSVVAKSKPENGGDLGSYDLLWKRVMEAALAAGGTISHHHGIGELKGPWMAAEHGPLQELYAGLKDRLDAAGVFNPGKLGLGAKAAGRARPGRKKGKAS